MNFRYTISMCYDTQLRSFPLFIIVSTAFCFARYNPMPYNVTHTIEGGIERVVYRPDQPRFSTPILMQHGMWHGAWCWRYWQELLAEWGWESHAFSLPGHAGSPVQRPIRWCT